MDQPDQPDQPEFGPSLPPMPLWLRRALRARYILLALYVFLTLGWYFAFFSQWDPLGISFGANANGEDLLTRFLIITAIVVGVQLLFLAGAPHLTWPRARRRRSIFVSLFIGSAIALLLSAGIVTALISLYQLIFAPGSFHTAIIGPAPTTAPAAVTTSDSSSDMSAWILLPIALIGWIFWFLVFALIGGSQWTRRFRWMYRALIAGTIIEMLITIPIDAAVRRRTNCYCGEGTFFSLIVGLTAILWTFGPGVAILFLIRRQQLVAERSERASRNYCKQCGYDLHGLASQRCPECGCAF